MIQVNELDNIDGTQYSTKYFVDRFDMNTLISLRKKFNRLKAEGTILSEFDDNEWKLMAYQKKPHKVQFSLSTKMQMNLSYHNITHNKFVEALKYFCLLNLNKNVVLTVKENIRFICKITDDSKCYRCIPDEVIVENKVDVVENWLNWLSIDVSEFIEKLRAISITPKKAHARMLADFQTYFIFDKEIHSYWGNAPKTEKIFFYPLWLFWEITTILPLRVVEFTVIPYECIKQNKDGKWYITIRRLNIKGHNDYVHNNLDDFRLCPYEVPERIAFIINEYRSLLEDGGYAEFQKNEKRLISSRMMHDNYPVPIYTNLNQFFNTDHVRILKDRMINDIFIGRLQHKLKTKKEIDADMKAGYVDSELGDHEISEWRCGDTRHLAMINLIMRGCSPMLIKEFAGHATSDMSAHYYSNAYKMVKASLFREKGARRIVEIPQSRRLTEKRLGEFDSIPCPGGYCSSPNYILGNGIECIKHKRCGTCNFHTRVKAISEEEHNFYSERIQKDFSIILKLVFSGSDFDIKKIEATIQDLKRKQNQYAKALIDESEVTNRWEENVIMIQNN